MHSFDSTMGTISEVVGSLKKHTTKKIGRNVKCNKNTMHIQPIVGRKNKRKKASHYYQNLAKKSDGGAKYLESAINRNA